MQHSRQLSGQHDRRAAGITEPPSTVAQVIDVVAALDVEREAHFLPHVGADSKLSQLNFESAPTLTLLTEQEQQLYRDLKQQRWGQNVRLEQERIDWATAWSVLQRALA